jgi:hypothetical protein
VAASQKNTLFTKKNGNSNYYEAKPETLFGRDVCNEEVHTLANFGCFITLYDRALRSTWSLGWKSQVKPYLIVLSVNTVLKKASIMQDWYSHDR